MRFERAIKQIESDIENEKRSLDWLETERDRFLVELTETQDRIAEKKENIKIQERAIKKLVEDNNIN